jgi:hypothetical protein
MLLDGQGRICVSLLVGAAQLIGARADKAALHVGRKVDLVCYPFCAGITGILKRTKASLSFL